eukprot:2689203-Prymnesium_polylepis.1
MPTPSQPSATVTDMTRQSDVREAAVASRSVDALEGNSTSRHSASSGVCRSAEPRRAAACANLLSSLGSRRANEGVCCRRRGSVSGWTWPGTCVQRRVITHVRASSSCGSSATQRAWWDLGAAAAHRASPAQRSGSPRLPSRRSGRTRRPRAGRRAAAAHARAPAAARARTCRSRSVAATGAARRRLPRRATTA